MATLNITLDFSSDNGDAELFTNGDSSGYSEGYYDGSEGNPSGSVRFDVANNTTNFEQKRTFYSTKQTFEDWGIPAGSTITSLSNFTIETAHFESGTNGTHWPGGGVQADGSTVFYNYPNSSQTGDTAWASMPAQTNNQGVFPVASTTYLDIFLDLDCNTGSDGTCHVHYDNISFDINYTPPAGFSGTGALQAEPATLSGVAQEEYNIALQAEPATASGYAYALPSWYQSAKEKTQDAYILYVDGAAVPMTGFTLQRTADGDDASVYVPKEYEAQVDAGTTLSIELESTGVDGQKTVTEIFSGAFSALPSTGRRRSRELIQRRLHGAPGTPTNAVREIGNVSYTTDDGNYYSIRSRVDERFWPGDVGMFQGRWIYINRVTFVVNQTQSFMELADVGQV